MAHTLTLTHDEALRLLADYPAVLTTRQVADALALSESTVKRRVRAGDLPAMKSRAGRGGRLRFSREAVARLMVAMAS